MKYVRKKYYSLIWTKFKLLIILYFVFIIAWLIIKTKMSLNEDFFKNWFVSFSEDLVFFGTGFLGIILGSKLPRDENFSTRISSLANGEYANKEAEHFLRIEIEKLMSYSKEHKINITVSKIDNEHKNVLIHVDSTCVVVNMCEDEQIPLTMKSYVVPGANVSGSLGNVLLHSIKREFDKSLNQKNPDPEFFIKEGHSVNLNELDGNKYSCTAQVHVFANGRAQTKLCYEIWLPIGADKNNIEDNWYFNGFNNYTENFNLSVENKLKMINIAYECDFPDRNVTQIDKASATNHTGTINATKREDIVLNKKFQKNDEFKMYFSISPKKETP